ncbi:unnamed protein product [Didymodactylos carnosus]|nr:unnamed protein product [Didymodactylos carnosus]CAF4258236.1 unnamed protein product [Didymodactylos carnosus]
MSTTRKNEVGLIAKQPVNQEPLIPSITHLAIRLDDGTKQIPYAQLYSTQSQGISDSNAHEITFDVGQTSLQGITLSSDDLTTITFSETGLYYVQAAAHVGGSGATASGNVHLWSRLNNVDIANSNTIQTVIDGSKSVVISQGIMVVQAGDTMELVFSSTSDSVGLVADFPKGEPANPSAAVSIGMIANSENLMKTPYTQLSSSVNQFVDDCSNEAQIVQFDVTGATIQRMIYDTSDRSLVFEERGTYFIIAAVQIGSETGNNETGSLDLWMRLNGIDIPDSNAQQAFPNAGTAVLPNALAIEVKAGDRLQILFSSTNKRLGLIGTTVADESYVPSIIFTAFKAMNTRS